TKIVSSPEELFEHADTFSAHASRFTRVEFGSRSALSGAQVFELSSAGQPSFNKDFALLTNNLADQQLKGYQNFIAADMPRQLERLHGIFGEIDPQVKLQPLEFALRQGFIDHTLKIVCYTDHQIFERFHRHRARERFSKSKALTLRELHTLQPGDFVTHIDY